MYIWVCVTWEFALPSLDYVCFAGGSRASLQGREESCLGCLSLAQSPPFRLSEREFPLVAGIPSQLLISHKEGRTQEFKQKPVSFGLWTSVLGISMCTVLPTETTLMLTRTGERRQTQGQQWHL